MHPAAAPRSPGRLIPAILVAAVTTMATAPSGGEDPDTTAPASRAATRRTRLPQPPPDATVDELLAYVQTITDPALEPDSKGRLRYHRRKVAALTAVAADAILAQLPEADPRHAAALQLKRDAEAAAMPPAEQADADDELRRSLFGKPIDLEGTLLDGAAFDQAALTGKVVLVDFWATWCGPCVAEIPRVRDLYDRYHDRGFEVIGISLDEDREALEAFVTDHEIPWPIIVDARPDDGSRSVLAARYGITAIPTMILVGRDGLVVSIEARGRRLEELLAEQFPEP